LFGPRVGVSSFGPSPLRPSAYSFSPFFPLPQPQSSSTGEAPPRNALPHHVSFNTSPSTMNVRPGLGTPPSPPNPALNPGQNTFCSAIPPTHNPQYCPGDEAMPPGFQWIFLMHDNLRQRSIQRIVHLRDLFSPPSIPSGPLWLPPPVLPRDGNEVKIFPLSNHLIYPTERIGGSGLVFFLPLLTAPVAPL